MRYKDAKEIAGGEATAHSCCVREANSDGTFSFCGAPLTGGRSRKYHICPEHLRCLCITIQDPADPKNCLRVRYCAPCKDWHPISNFSGVATACNKHLKGRQVRGGPPAVAATQQEVPAEVVQTERQCKTLVVGGHGGPDIKQILHCDVCGKQCDKKKPGLCKDCRVRFHDV